MVLKQKRERSRSSPNRVENLVFDNPFIIVGYHEQAVDGTLTDIRYMLHPSNQSFVDASARLPVNAWLPVDVLSYSLDFAYVAIPPGTYTIASKSGNRDVVLSYVEL